ncbi:MAG: DUF962 domain-containing protein [Methyloceanibacter sp.]
MQRPRLSVRRLAASGSKRPRSAERRNHSKIAILGMVLGYVFAWSGHFLIERNRPSVLAHPVWSFQCDVRMLWLWLGGRLNEERARAE